VFQLLQLHVTVCSLCNYYLSQLHVILHRLRYSHLSVLCFHSFSHWWLQYMLSDSQFFFFWLYLIFSISASHHFIFTCLLFILFNVISFIFMHLQSTISNNHIINQILNTGGFNIPCTPLRLDIDSSYRIYPTHLFRVIL